MPNVSRQEDPNILLNVTATTDNAPVDTTTEPPMTAPRTCPVTGELFDLDQEGNWVEGYDSPISDEGYDRIEAFMCDRCELHYSHEHYGDDGVCQSCLDQMDEEEDEEYPIEDEVSRSERNVLNERMGRNLDLSNKDHQSPDGEYGQIIKSDRSFGVELEVFSQKLKSLTSLAQDIDKAFSLTHDGSIRGNNPVEVVSPILKGRKGEKAIKEVTATLKEKSFEVNESCGFHVHLSAPEYANTPSSQPMSFEELFGRMGSDGRIEDDTQVAIISPEALNIAKMGGVDIYSSLVSGYLSIESTSEFKQVYTFKHPRTKEVSSIMGIKIPRKMQWLFFSHNTKGDKFLFLSSPTTTEPNANDFIPHYEPTLRSQLNEKWAKLTEEVKNTPEANYLSEGIYYSGLSVKSRVRDWKDRLIDRKYGIKIAGKHLDLLGIDYAQFMETFKVQLTMSNTRAFENTKKLLYFYTFFSDVFLAMLPSSRRKMTGYCRPLDTAFSLVDINNLNSQEELEFMWYKTRDKGSKDQRKTGGKYDESRYYGLNLHILFNKGKTVEIRYHSGTTNAEKVLMWTAIHQTILDKIPHAYNLIGDLQDSGKTITLEDKIRVLFRVMEFRKSLKQYILDRINYFSKTQMTLESVKAKVTNPSDNE